MNREDCFLISTSHLSDRILFRDDSDFAAAMNIVAIAAFLTGVKVLCFVLMSNHVHFVVLADADGAKRFINCFKSLYGFYAKQHKGIRKLLRSNEVDIRRVSLDNESPERAIAYVLMNPVAANICPHPSQYEWGCGSLFFNVHPSQGKTLGDLSARAQIRILHSNVRLPQDYRLTPAGYISPSNYIQVSYVERLFRTPKRFNFFLMNSSKARSRLEERPLPAFRDQIIREAIKDLIRTLFRKEFLEALDNAEKAELMRQAHRRFCADIAQLSRITGIPYAEISEMLEAF